MQEDRLGYKRIMTVLEIALLVLLVAISLGMAVADESVQPVGGWLNLYVSPEGDDGWSGRLLEPNVERTDGPVASLAGARDVLRKVRKERGEINQPVTVYVRGGVYNLSDAVVFEPEDSGLPGCPVTFTAYRNERPMISGGTRITGWRETEVNGRKMWAVDIPDVKEGKWYFTQLFADGRRLPRTRVPKEGLFHIEELKGVTQETKYNQGQSEFRYAEGDIKQWRNLSDVDIVVLHFWREARIPIASVNEEAREIKLAKKSAHRLTDDHTMQGAPYYIENVFEALEEPGHWYLDRVEGILYYIPLPGEDIRKTEFVVPRIPHLLTVKGGPNGEKVKHLNLEKLTFAHTDWTMPENMTGMGQASFMVPAAVTLEEASFCTIKHCDITRTANYAVEFGEGCEDNLISGSRLYDLGAGGVKLNHGSKRTTVEDNEIRSGGRIFHSAVGVWIGHSGHNRVSHNHIHDMYYSGISVGWVWGYKESEAVGNVIEYNHIHHVGQGMLSDLGGIYSLGVSPGTVLRNNLIHDCVSRGYGGWGIYTDEGSSYILVENNVVYNTKTGGFHQHFGKDNIIRNNIFCYAVEQQIQWSSVEAHNAFSFERNIVCWNQGNILGGRAIASNNCRIDHNLYWDERESEIIFAGATFEKWQERGFDIHSLIADPKFADPKAGNFTLAPDSPAFTLGFQPIDVSKVGPRKTPGVGKSAAD